MKNKWSEGGVSEFMASYGDRWGTDLALRTYSSRLLGGEDKLILHGGGSGSVKSTYTNVLGEDIAAVFVSASDCDMSVITPDQYPGLDLAYLRKLRGLPKLSPDKMINALCTHILDYGSPKPSADVLIHTFHPKKFVDYARADAVLALTDQPDGGKIVREALGEGVIVQEYGGDQFVLAKAASDALAANPRAKAIVVMHKGLLTWGDTARESYDLMIGLVTKAEEYLGQHACNPLKVTVSTPLETARGRVPRVAPMIRGFLARPCDSDDRSYRHVILQTLVNREVLDFLDSDRGKKYALTQPLTPDHAIYTKSLPLWVDSPDYDHPDHLREQFSQAIGRYKKEYYAFLKQYSDAPQDFDPRPRVILMPALGAICAGEDAKNAGITRDITSHTLAVKSQIAAMGEYQGLSGGYLVGPEAGSVKSKELSSKCGFELGGKVGLVTGAAGAIGSGICRGLLEHGCHVAVSDLAGPNLVNLVEELRSKYGERVIGVVLDVTDSESVARGLEEIICVWGGVDIAVVNAGIALVSSLKDMDLAAFRRLEQINVEGTLLILRELARHFELQNTGGDIIFTSTKNVFAPGAMFGAYSATKAAAHQLARIASLELAPLGVRVNMVAPDAVFSDGARKSGLWQEIGPARMKARGLDEKGLEEYYRSRNLLKAKVTADHVANAVLFFASRQTPTTGATIPVDGGLPDATPR